MRSLITVLIHWSVLSQLLHYRKSQAWMACILNKGPSLDIPSSAIYNPRKESERTPL
jgi:hypothetical protein